MTDILSNNKIPRIYAYTEPQFKETPWKNRRQGKGLIKVGFTTKTARKITAIRYFNIDFFKGLFHWFLTSFQIRCHAIP